MAKVFRRVSGTTAGWPGHALRLGAAMAVLAALVGAGSGFGYRFGLWPLETAVNLLLAGAVLGLAAALVSLAALVLGRRLDRRQQFGLGIAGLALGSVVFAIPLYYALNVLRVPPIHDITTDTGNPPAFVAILALRQGAPNPPTYGGAVIAQAQRQAYPDIAPAELAVAPGEALRRCLELVHRLGWQVVAVDAAAGRIEAVDTTRWFGFKDDIVVRVTPTDTGSRVDLRSASRVGQSDIGTNAARVRTFLARLAAIGPATKAP